MDALSGWTLLKINISRFLWMQLDKQKKIYFLGRLDLRALFLRQMRHSLIHQSISSAKHIHAYDLVTSSTRPVMRWKKSLFVINGGRDMQFWTSIVLRIYDIDIQQTFFCPVSYMFLDVYRTECPLSPGQIRPDPQRALYKARMR